MISIRDSDLHALQVINKLLSNDEPNSVAIKAARQHSANILLHISELSQQAPMIEPRVAPMSEADKRICYPERFPKKNKAVFVHMGGLIYTDGPIELPGWYFWDETWADYHGPFATKEEADTAIMNYAKSL